MNALSVPVLVAVGCTLYAGVYNLSFYQRARQGREHLWFGLVCLWMAAYGVFSALLYSSSSFETSVWYQRGQFSSIALIAVCLFPFLRAAAGTPWPRGSVALPVFWAAFAILSWLDSPLLLHLSQPAPKRFTVLGEPIAYLEVEPGPLLLAFYASVFVGMAVASVLLVKAHRTDRSKRLTALTRGLSVFFVASIHDILVGAGVLESIYLVEYSFLVMMLVMDQTLLARFLAAFRRIERLRVELEDRVQERTREIAALAEELRARNAELSEKNEQLTALTERDGLTGLLNHAAFWRRLEAILNMARRQKFSVSMAMVDVDHFKTLNDRCGHLAGDEILRAVAGVLAGDIRDYDLKSRFGEDDHASQPTLRDYDVAGRYGGDEFALTLVFCDEQGARAALGRVAEQISQLPLDHLGDVALTLSIGVCVLTDASACEDAAALVEQADACLYEAKRAGRNQLVVRTYAATGSGDARPEASAPTKSEAQTEG